MWITVVTKEMKIRGTNQTDITQGGKKPSNCRQILYGDSEETVQWFMKYCLNYTWVVTPQNILILKRY